MKFNNVYFINGTAYAGTSTMVKLLAEKYNGISCEENYHDRMLEDLDKDELLDECSSFVICRKHTTVLS